MKRTVLTLTALLALGTPVFPLSDQTPPRAQAPPPAGSGVMSGALTAADTGQPLRRAQVTASSTSPRFSRTTTTDGEGRWVLDELPAAEFMLLASRPGYLDMIWGARRPGRGQPGTPITLGAGQRIENLSFALLRGGVVAGFVMDEYGDPAFNVPVRALRFTYQNGERVVQTAGNTVTDDLGAYRIAGLLPGEYLVTAVPRDTVAAEAARVQALREVEVRAAAAGGGTTGLRPTIEAARFTPINITGYVPVYYPGSASPAASAVVPVGVSQQVHGIDIRLQVVETTTVAGRVTDVSGNPISGNVQLIDPGMPIATVGVWFQSTRDGTFSFAGVVPGAYVLRAHNSPPGTIGGPPSPGGEFQMSAPVAVNAAASGIRDVELRMVAGSTVSGRIDLTGVPADRSALRVRLMPVSTAADWELGAFQVSPDPEGRFTLTGVVSARYRVDVTGLPAGWRLDSAVFSNREAADHHLVVEPGQAHAGGVLTLTSRSGEVGGVVANSQGAPVAHQSIVLFPENRALWIPQSRRIHIVETGADGRYVFRNLPAGDYRLAVLPEIEPGRHFDPEYLGHLATISTVFTLGDGEKKMQDVRVR